jgi:hypothetical protein
MDTKKHINWDIIGILCLLVSIFTPKVCTIRHTIFKHAQQQDTKFVLGIIHLLLKKMDRATGKQEKKEVDSTFGTCLQ